MSSHDEPATADEELDRQFINALHAAQPDGPTHSSFWKAIAQDDEALAVHPAAEAKAFDVARAALALTRKELTLGTYLGQRRTAAQLSREAAGRAATLAPQTIAELEADRCPILSVEPTRLAKLAVAVSAAKPVLLVLAERASPSLTNGAAPPARLMRLDASASRLEAERAVRRTQAAKPKDMNAYLEALASAFDAEVARTRPA